MVIEAIGTYLRRSNANLGGLFRTSRHTGALVGEARARAAGFLGCPADAVIFGPNMTTLNFALTRVAARELSAGDEVIVTRLDHDANIAPWLELARDFDLVIRFVDVRGDTTLDMDGLEQMLGPRTRIVAFPWASNAVGTLVDVARVSELAHSVGALAWIDAVHYAAHGPIDVVEAGADVLLCSPYKFFGPHLGLAYVRRELLERWLPYRVRHVDGELLGQCFETGTLQHELLAGFVAAIDYVDSVGFDAIEGHERELGERLLAGLPKSSRLHGLSTMQGRVPTFALTFDPISPREVAQRLGDDGIAVWHGYYKATEIMRRLGLEDGGAVRIGIVHYNTADEVDRLLAALESL
jgi:cysteine desulfurase family protein (TIGR01976 family)